MPWRAKVSTPRQAVATTARPAAMASSTGMPQASYRLLNRNASCPQYSSGNTSCTQADTVHVTCHASLPTLASRLTCTSIAHCQLEAVLNQWRQLLKTLRNNSYMLLSQAAQTIITCNVAICIPACSCILPALLCKIAQLLSPATLSTHHHQQSLKLSSHHHHKAPS